MVAHPVAGTAAPDTLEAALDQFRPLLGERLSLSQAVREQHGRDEGYHLPVAPDAVAFARSTEEVAAIVKVCAAHGVPVVPYGTGTALEGGVAALHGGVAIDLSGLNQVLRVSAEDLDCTAQEIGRASGRDREGQYV